MKNPFTVNPSSLEFLLCPPIRLAQADSDRENISWTEEQCRYAAHAINQHEKLVGQVETLKDVVSCLLLSADCSWADGLEGHDWCDACDRARAALLKEEKP